LQSSQESLRSELEATKAELQATKTKQEATQAEMQNKNEGFDNLLKEAQEKAESALVKTKNTQDSVNTARTEIESVKFGIETGSIVAQKALMLRGKDDNHWMRFSSKLDDVNHHYLKIWITDNTWHDDIRVKAATLLRASDDNHWMRFQYLKKDYYHTFLIWKSDNTWHHAARVGAADKLVR